MTRREAEAEAIRLNLEATRREEASRPVLLRQKTWSWWRPVQRGSGVWDVEERVEVRSFWERIEGAQILVGR